ncbi:MAG: radical SAM protein [Nanoarchaeota archaeon]|nr:radical SAM protein [Nanoarchaeota archaeon]
MTKRGKKHIKKTKFYSYLLGKLPKGCQLCVKGEKLVLFATGLCPRCCYYCSISDKKYGKDVVYANEWPTSNISDIIKEARLCSSKGAGITGGDPLCKIDRTVKYIRALKKEFGKNFHIHLYTSLDLVNENSLSRLYKAGLDEIRFHVDLDSNNITKKKIWPRLFVAKHKRRKWAVGIEIPAIPGKENKTKEIIDYFAKHIDFLNLNELEVADNKVNKLTKMGFRTKDQLSYAIKGSEELARKLLVYAARKHPKLNMHYCTAKLKDKVQLANRIKLRAKNIAKDYDTITKEGLLIRGAIYGAIPVIMGILKHHDVPKNLIGIDKKRTRILTSIKVADVLKEALKNKGAMPAIVEEYPTYDCFQVDVEFL